MFYAATPTPVVTSNQYTETINAFANMSIGIAALFVLALFAVGLIAYLYTNRDKDKGTQTMLTTFSQAMGKTLAERDERIEVLEAEAAKREDRYNEGLMAVGDGMNRIADVVEVLRKDGAERDRILSDATSAMTAIVTVGSKPLQQVVKTINEVKDTDDEIKKVVTQIFDRFVTVFPTDKSLDDRFDTLKKAILEGIDKACKDTPPPAVVVNNVTPVTPADELPKASGA